MASSGHVQLAVTGLQDELITGSPDITYFQKRFTKHTKFALELMDNPFEGEVDFGTTSRCIIQRRGDLIRNIYLRIELPALNTAATSNVGYSDSIGHSIIEYADLIIGGQTIERITGEYMEIFTELFVVDSQQFAVRDVVGKTYKRTGLGPASVDQTVTNNFFGTYPRTFIVNLPFYFNRSDSLSIPLCALTRQEVEVEIKFRPLDQVIVTPDASVTGGPTVGNVIRASMPTEYVFLGDEERNLFMNSSLEYIITQLQLSRSVMEANLMSKTFRLRFVNPVKEMYIMIQDKDKAAANVVTGNDHLNYQNPLNTSNPLYNQLSTMSLTFNNEIMISGDVADALYLHDIEPMNHHSRVPRRLFYNYSFALDPENYLPTGQVNMSRINNKLLTLNTPTPSVDRDVRIYAKSINILKIRDGLAGLLFADNNSV